MSSLTALLKEDDSPVFSPALRETLAHWQTLPPPPLDKPHQHSRYVILNTRASGLDSNQTRLEAVAAVAVDNCRIRLNHSYHAAPGSQPQAVMAELLNFAGSGPVVVYNASLNQRLLEREFARHLGLTPPWLWIDLHTVLPTIFADQATQRPQRLSQWMETLGVSTFRHHDALGDAYAIAKLWLALLAHASTHGYDTAEKLARLQEPGGSD